MGIKGEILGDNKFIFLRTNFAWTKNLPFLLLYAHFRIPVTMKTTHTPTVEQSALIVKTFFSHLDIEKVVNPFREHYCVKDWHGTQKNVEIQKLLSLYRHSAFLGIVGRGSKNGITPPIAVGYGFGSDGSKVWELLTTFLHFYFPWDKCQKAEQQETLELLLKQFNWNEGFYRSSNPQAMGYATKISNDDKGSYEILFIVSETLGKKNLTP